MAPNRRLRRLMEAHLISESMLANESGVDVKTVGRVLKGKTSYRARMQTKRLILDGLNRLLARDRKGPMGPEIFRP